jgi:imidazoleglycerol-phosphate dehydratase / histidinol-phosphatase
MNKTHIVVEYPLPERVSPSPRKVLFIDRDGTLINEAPPTYQLDAFDKLTFYKDMFWYMRRIATELDYELVMVTNQDGLGSDTFPEDTFWPLHQLVMKSLEGEQIFFSKVFIDRTYPADGLPTRKPGTGMLTEYFDAAQYDLANSFVIGDRITDMQLAKNLGCKGIWLNNGSGLGSEELQNKIAALQDTIALDTPDWEKVYQLLLPGKRSVVHTRNTNETKIEVTLNLDGTGIARNQTGLGFFDHMLDQLARHGQMDIAVTCAGDLHIDEHHTIEDCAIALGEAMDKAIGDKRGMERYGFVLPMDDCLAQVAVDFGGRSWLVWEASFTREKIGEMPTEMFYHFFKSFSDAARCNLNIQATGNNEHHKIEAIFKAFAKAIRMAVSRDRNSKVLPSTKGIL